jgi:hypothetical protein
MNVIFKLLLHSWMRFNLFWKARFASLLLPVLIMWLKLFFSVTEQVTVVVTCIREIPGMNLGRVCDSFPQAFQANSKEYGTPSLQIIFLQTVHNWYVYLSQDISELRWPLMASQPRYGDGGEAIAHKASCSPLALSIFLPPHAVMYLTLADILRPVYFQASSNCSSVCFFVCLCVT